jgi:UDP-N-acetylglucosamine--N-acetylmuramyl-(pentapeptide) pyrophosphoryl-undecaprenol N-acetylglucosamine transferase
MKILLTGGGTAGHAWPIILVAKALQKNKRNRVLYVGTGGIEKELAKKSDIPFKKILAGKKRAYFSILNFFDIFKTLFGLIQAFFLLLFFRPKVIFAKGGYVTFPIIFWVKLFKIPLVIHESDSVIGRTNAYAAKKASKICLGFPVRYYENLNISLDRVIYTGIPIGDEFFQTQIKMADRPNILITGGSQGSSRINKIIAEILPKLLEKYSVTHISGENDFDQLNKLDDPNYHLVSFSYEMSKYFRDADLVISRAGASTLAEISASEKAAIIIPLPESASDHQAKNAKVYGDLNAAVVLGESHLSAESLLSIVKNLLSDEKMRELLGHHAKSLSRPGATNEIVDILFEVTANANTPED